MDCARGKDSGPSIGAYSPQIRGYNPHMSSLLFGLGTVGPVFLVIAIGIGMRRAKLIDSDLASQMSRLVFHLFLPALLLKALISADFRSLLSLPLVLTVWGILFTSVALAILTARLFGIDRQYRGLFTSGATWGNVAIVGYALGEALYGEPGLARAAIFSALVLPLHTPLGFLLMDRHLAAEGRKGFLPAMIRRIVRNPVLMAILIGLILNALLRGAGWEMPGIVLELLDILARASLPLALVAIGASLEFGRQGAGWRIPLGASFIKLLMMPLLAFLVTAFTGMDEYWRGSVILGFSCPTAVSFFVISRSLGFEGKRGASIVTATTVGAALSVGFIAIVLKAVGLA